MWLVKIWFLLIVCWVIVLGVRIFAENNWKRLEISSWSGLLFGVFTIIVAFPILIPFINRTQVHSRLYTIDTNLKRWGLVFKMYSNESPGELFPPLTQQEGLWVPDFHAICPEYLADPYIACVPEDQTDAKRKMFEDIFYQDPLKGTIDLDKTAVLMAQTYVYTGWVVQNESDVEVMKHCRNEKGVHIGDVESEGTHLWWMREGVEGAFITDTNDPQASAIAQSTIPVMVARPRPQKHTTVVPVLFMDGHVEKIPLDTAPAHIKALVELFPELLK